MVLWKYRRRLNDDNDICATFDGKIFDSESNNRPVPPSEGRGFTTTHPNCKCYWTIAPKNSEPDSMLKSIGEYIKTIHKKIGQKARWGTLHTVFEDGHISQRTRGTNPRHA